MKFREYVKREPIFSYAIYYWLSSPLIKILAKTSITPNQISFLYLILAIIGGVLFSFGIYLYSIIAMLLVQIYQILDCVDGEIARMKNIQCKYGEWVELNTDMVIVLPLFLGISIGVYRDTHDLLTLILGTIVIANMYLVEVTRAYRAIFTKKDEIRDVIGELRRFGVMRHFAYCKSNVYLLMILFALLNKMFLFLLFIAIYGSLFYLTAFIYLTMKMKKEKNNPP